MPLHLTYVEGLLHFQVPLANNIDPLHLTYVEGLLQQDESNSSFHYVEGLLREVRELK